MKLFDMNEATRQKIVDIFYDAHYETQPSTLTDQVLAVLRYLELHGYEVLLPQETRCE